MHGWSGGKEEVRAGGKGKLEEEERLPSAVVS